MRWLVMVLLVLFLSGCYVQYDSIRDTLPVRQQSAIHHETVDTVLKHYFTDEAYAAIKDIPMVEGVAYTPYVVGVNSWSVIFSILVGNGYDRKVVMTRSSLGSWGISSIIHEYTHHLDDMDRDGLGEFIDHDEFIAAYKKMGRDQKYAGIVHYVERKADYWFTNWFGIGKYAEYIAYTADYIFNHDSPEYLKHVFKRILRFK